MNYNTLIISGFPKCRTTYYYQKLVSNSNFHSSANKELKFDFTNNKFEMYDALLVKYCTSKFKIDASPEYCYQYEFFQFLKSRKDILNILLYRDPIERLESVLNFKKYTIGDLYYENIDLIAENYLKKNKSPFDIVFERTRYENYSKDIVDNTFIFNCNDEVGIFNKINQSFEDDFDYSKLRIKNTNPTKKIDPSIQYIVRNFKYLIPRTLKDKLSFLKKTIKKDEFSSDIKHKLIENYSKTYEWINQKTKN